MQTSATYRKSLGFETFAHAPHATLEDLPPGACAVFGVPDEPGPGRRAGTALGPVAIRESVALHLATYGDGEVVNLLTGLCSRLRSAPALRDLGDLAPALCGNDVVNRVVEELVAELRRRSSCPVMLGGSPHSLAPFLRGMLKVDSSFRTLVISNSVEPLARVVDIHASLGNEPPAAFLLGPCGLQVTEHWDSTVRAGAKVVTAESMHTNEEVSLNMLAAWIEGDESPCCLVLDMQALDSGYASGTPQIDIGGMTPQQFIAASQRLRSLPVLAGAAVFNCAPALDLRGHTEHLAAHGLVQAMASLLFEPVQT